MKGRKGRARLKADNGLEAHVERSRGDVVVREEMGWAWVSTARSRLVGADLGGRRPKTSRFAPVEGAVRLVTSFEPRQARLSAVRGPRDRLYADVRFFQGPKVP